MAKLTSRTGKADVQVSPDGVSIIFSNKDGLQIYWPASDWPALNQFVRGGIERATNPANRPPVSDAEVDAEVDKAMEKMRTKGRRHRYHTSNPPDLSVPAALGSQRRLRSQSRHLPRPAGGTGEILCK